MTKIKKDNSKLNQAAWWLPAVILFARLTVWIAVPIIISLFVGHSLDRKFGTEPWLFLATIALAFFISMVGIVKNTSEEYKKIEEENKKQDN